MILSTNVRFAKLFHSTSCLIKRLFSSPTPGIERLNEWRSEHTLANFQTADKKSSSIVTLVAGSTRWMVLWRRSSNAMHRHSAQVIPDHDGHRSHGLILLIISTSQVLLILQKHYGTCLQECRKCGFRLSMSSVWRKFRKRWYWHSDIFGLESPFFIEDII